MIAGTVSKHKTKNYQVYGTSFVWTLFFPMTLKSDAHDTLLLLFKRDGVPPEMIMDNIKEQLSSNFRKKLCDYTFYQKTIKIHSP